jgi:collagen type VII alpha
MGLILSLSTVVPASAEPNVASSDGSKSAVVRGVLGPLVMIPGTSKVIIPRSVMVPAALMGPLKRYANLNSSGGQEVLIVTGSSGASAFEIWKEQTGRFDATTEEFISSLITAGPPGLRGARGPLGAQGVIGVAGVAGVAGASGAQGEKGADGVTTIQELDGVDGESAYQLWFNEHCSADQEDVTLDNGTFSCDQAGFLKSMQGGASTETIIREDVVNWSGTLQAGALTCPNNQKITSIVLVDISTDENPNTKRLGVQCKDNGNNNAKEGNGGFDPDYDDTISISSPSFRSAFDSWKFVNKKPNATEEEFVASLQGENGKSAFDLWNDNQLQSSNNGQAKKVDITDFFTAMKGERGEQGPIGLNGFSAIEVWRSSLPNSYRGPTDVAAFLDAITGARGAQGDKGDKGDKGDRGDRGEQGLQGLAGPQGPAGPQGVAGASAFEIWKATVGKNNATVSEYLIAITGAQGPTGTPGVQGPSGAAGKNNYELWKDSLPNSNKKNSFADFLVAVSGPKGDRGEIGAQGPQGIQGVAGPTGAQGQIGPVGPQGPQGIQGMQGPTGERGEKGEQGIQGVAGPQGDKGERGANGALALAESTQCAPGQVIQSLRLNAADEIEATCAEAAPSLGEAAICVAENGSISWGTCSNRGTTYYIATKN